MHLNERQISGRRSELLSDRFVAQSRTVRGHANARFSLVGNPIPESPKVQRNCHWNCLNWGDERRRLRRIGVRKGTYRSVRISAVPA